MQSWAQLEEEQGLYQRGSELRSYSLQEQTTLVAPLKLGTQPDDPLLTSVFKQVDCYFAALLCHSMDAQLPEFNAVLPMCSLPSARTISWCLASGWALCKACSHSQQHLCVVSNDLTADDAHVVCPAVSVRCFLVRVACSCSADWGMDSKGRGGQE